MEHTVPRQQKPILKVHKADVNVDGGFTLDPAFFVDFGDERPHQIRLSGGDSSSDSFCYPS